MQKNTDLTLFWLAWRKTCSIRLCCQGHEKEFCEKCRDAPVLIAQMSKVQGLAADVVASMNNRFRLLVCKENDTRVARRSEYDSELQSWQEGVGSAFELLESYLYNKQTINGKAVKSYLFEDAANRPGGMNRNLFGYLQRVLASMIEGSYGENIYLPAVDEDGNEIDSPSATTGGSPETVVHTPDEYADAHEVAIAFRQYLMAHENEWDSDRWLVVYCMLNVLPVGGESLQPLFEKKKSTISIWYSQMRSEILQYLSEGCSKMAIGMALNGTLQQILDEHVKNQRWYVKAQQILEEKRKSAGN